METKIPIFRKFVIQNFPYIEEDFDALTDYQLFSKVVEYLNKCIKATNQTVEQMATLQAYVDHYFDSLDVQNEINNKLEEMAQSGELTDIIAQYLGLAGVLAYDTISDMASADNLADGSICRVLGNTNYKNGDGAYYKIRQLINTDIVDGYHLVAITNAPTLVAERITDIDHLPFYAYYLYSSTTSNFGDSTVYLGEKNIIVDFGNDNHTTNDFLTAKGVTKIDAIVITHYHDDHIGTSTGAGLSAVLNNSNIDFSNCVAYLPHKGIDYEEWTNPESYQNAETTIKTILNNANITCVEPNNEQEIALTGNIKLSFYNIGSDFYEEYYDITWNSQTNANNFSMMLLVDAYGKRFFNGGDMESKACELNAKYLNNVDVYHTLHHGINLNTPIEWNVNLAPKYAIITRRDGGSNGTRYSASDVTASLSKGATLIDIVNSEETEEITVQGGNIISSLNSEAPYTANITANPTNTINEPIDLNDLVTCGTFFVPTGDIFSQCTNIPPAVIKTGSKYTGARIDVISTTNATGKEGVRQIVSYQNLFTSQDEIFYRTYVGSNNTWNRWAYIQTSTPNNTDVWIRTLGGTCWVTAGAKEVMLWIPYGNYQYTDDTTLSSIAFTSLNVRVPTGGYLLNNVASSNTDYVITHVKGSSLGFYINIKKADNTAFNINNNTNCAFEIWGLEFHIDAL